MGDWNPGRFGVDLFGQTMRIGTLPKLVLRNPEVIQKPPGRRNPVVCGICRAAKCCGQAFNLNAIEDVLYLFQFFTWHFACSVSFHHHSKITTPFRFFVCPKWFRFFRPVFFFWTWPIFPSRIGSFIYLIRQRRRVAKPPDLAKVEELKDEVPTKSFEKQSLFVVFCFCYIVVVLFFSCGVRRGEAQKRRYWNLFVFCVKLVLLSC